MWLFGLQSKMLDWTGWSGLDTPQTVMTTRAPAKKRIWKIGGGWGFIFYRIFLQEANYRFFQPSGDHKQHPNGNIEEV